MVSVAMSIAVAKPKDASVMATSLSIVLGCARCCAGGTWFQWQCPSRWRNQKMRRSWPRRCQSSWAVRGAVQAVNGFSGNVHRGGETKRCVGHGHVVVNRLGQRDDIETGFVQAQGIFLRAAAAEADNAIESPFLVIGDDGLGHVARAAVNDHAVRLVAAGAKDGAAYGENSRERGAVEFEPSAAPS